ncbi:22015_t:CDS:2, partial [Dentiscutata erythropus]
PFPYDWFNTPEKIDTTSLPSIEAFDTDCLERFHKLMKSKFELDIAHYVSLSSFAENALYKTTGQEIELFTDDNIYLFCEKGIRGGILIVSNRQVEANNLQHSDFVSETEEAMKKLYTWLLYVDANALYTGAIMQYISTGGHRWIIPEETPDLFNKITKWEIPDNAEKCYILEIAHTLYPLAPENIEISKEEMSKCEQEIINDLKHYTKTKKLIPNLNNKKKPEGESKKFKKLVANSSYKSHRILAENLVGISHHQSKARLSKPIFIGMSVLDEMVYTDTDSLILLIRTENVYKDMAEMHEHFDFSDYKSEHPIYKALGKEKIKKFLVSLRMKVAVLLCVNFVDQDLSSIVIFLLMEKQIEELKEYKRLGSKDHIIRLLRLSKV